MRASKPNSDRSSRLRRCQTGRTHLGSRHPPCKACPTSSTSARWPLGSASPDWAGVAVFAPERRCQPVTVEPPETRLFEEDFTLGEPSPAENASSEATAQEPPATPETPPAPPELPDLAESIPCRKFRKFPLPHPPPRPVHSTPVASSSPEPGSPPPAKQRQTQRLQLQLQFHRHHRFSRHRWHDPVQPPRRRPHAAAVLPGRGPTQRPDRHRARRVHRGHQRPRHLRPRQILLRLAACSTTRPSAPSAAGNSRQAPS